jgi:hypothetical protein
MIANDDDRVSGVRLRLWTATTNGPIVHPPGDTWVWRAMEWYRQGKTPDTSTRALWNSYQHRHLVTSRRNGRKEWEFSLTKYFCSHLQVMFLHSVKSTVMGPPAILPLTPEERRAADFYRRYKAIASAGPRNFGLTTCTLTITPPRRRVISASDFEAQLISIRHRIFPRIATCVRTMNNRQWTFREACKCLCRAFPI